MNIPLKVKSLNKKRGIYNSKYNSLNYFINSLVILMHSYICWFIKQEKSEGVIVNMLDKGLKILNHVEVPEYKPNGLNEACTLLDMELKKGLDAKILVYYDPDIDGLMAGFIMEGYLTRLGYGTQCKNYRYYLNSDRTHGFKLSDSQLKQLKGYTIIAVDFSIPKEDYDRILQAGINLINIDHHEIDISSYTKLNSSFIFSKCKDNYGVILNNQYKTEPDDFRFLSGAGMVFYFIQELSKRYNIEVPKDYAALVGITLLSDIREIESKNARSFLCNTFTCDSEYLKYLQWLVTSESYSSRRFSSFGIPRMCRNFIDFTFSPVINALLRADKGEVAINLLRYNQEIVNKYREHDYLLKFRDVQKEVIASILNEIKEAENRPGSFTRKYSKMMVCCLTEEFKPTIRNTLDSQSPIHVTNYIGVACSKIKDEDKTGVIFVIDSKTNRVIRGSVRGGRDGVDYLSIFRKNGVPSAGHHNAFGILPCDVSKIDFVKLNSDIEQAEKEVSLYGKNTRTVLPIERLDVLSRSPQFKMICLYNELSRDNLRIYLKYTGDYEKIRAEKISDKYIKYYIDGICVNCYDASLNIKDCFILPGFENGNYVHFTLRPKFEYDFDSTNSDVNKKLCSL